MIRTKYFLNLEQKIKKYESFHINIDSKTPETNLCRKEKHLLDVEIK